MKTTDPLQGFIMAANHYLVHLTLLIAQPICMAYWQGTQCNEGEL